MRISQRFREQTTEYLREVEKKRDEIPSGATTMHRAVTKSERCQER